MARANRTVRVLTRLLLLALLWWALAESDLSGLLFGGVLVVAATLLSVSLIPPLGRLSFLALPAFTLFFLSEMFKGGVDVARRAFHPALPVDPGFVIFPLRLRGEGQRIFLTWTAGLLPGTVSVKLKEQALEIHVLDRQMPVQETLQRLEDRIAALLPDDRGPV